MSSTTTGARRAVPPAPTAGPAATDLSAATGTGVDRAGLKGRGVTVIADKVFEKIAGQAASEVARSRGRSGGVLGIGAGADADARPKVGVDLSADSVDLDLAVGIAYPGSIRAAAQEVREHVARRVRDLTGVQVHRVDIDVTFLDTSSTSVMSSKQTRTPRKQVLR